MEAYLSQGELLKISDLNAELHEKLLQIARHRTVTACLTVCAPSLCAFSTAPFW